MFISLLFHEFSVCFVISSFLFHSHFSLESPEQLSPVHWISILGWSQFWLIKHCFASFPSFLLLFPQHYPLVCDQAFEILFLWITKSACSSLNRSISLCTFFSSWKSSCHILYILLSKLRRTTPISSILNSLSDISVTDV